MNGGGLGWHGTSRHTHCESSAAAASAVRALAVRGETVTDFLPGCGRSRLAAALSQEVVQDGTVRAICNSSPWQGPHRRHSLPIHMKLVQGERGPEWFC